MTDIMCVKHYFKLTRASIIKIKEWQDKTNEHKAATKMKMTSSQKNDTGKVVFYLFDDHREGRETTWLKRVPRACENTLLFRASTVKFGGKSRIRGSGPRVAYKRFELSGNHVRNPLYPRVTTHGRHLHISVWLSRNTPVSGPVYFAPDLSLSLSLSFIFTFIPERVNGCIRVILSHLTLRLPSLRMENNTRPGVDPSFSNSEHASLPLIRAFCRYARERIWGDGGSVLSCPREEWNSKIVKYFAVREIEAKTVDSAFLCILKNIQDVCVVVSSPDCCHLSSSSWINFVERVDKFRGAK